MSSSLTQLIRTRDSMKSPAILEPLSCGRYLMLSKELSDHETYNKSSFRSFVDGS